MMNSDKHELFRRYVEGELTEEEEKEALHLFADNKDMRSMLKFELRMKQFFRSEPDLSSFEVPEGFTDNVMSEVRSIDLQAKEERNKTILSWIDWLWQPQPLQWRPAYAMVLILLLAVTLTIPFGGTQESSELQESRDLNGSTVQTVSESTDEVWLRFVFIDQEAKSVAVAGDFSNWKPVELNRQEVDGQMVWTGLVSMSRGEHRYMFVKNGEEWVTDPLAPMHSEDGFGNKNAVIYL